LATLVFWKIAAQEKILSQTAFYLYKIGLLKDKSQVELNAIECWRYQKYNCARNYIKLIDIDKSRNSQIVAIGGALLSMSGEHKEAANYLNKVSDDIKDAIKKTKFPQTQFRFETEFDEPSIKMRFGNFPAMDRSRFSEFIDELNQLVDYDLDVYRWSYGTGPLSED
jgi:hypothetical protein